jgi:hypothetical protein
MEMRAVSRREQAVAVALVLQSGEEWLGRPIETAGAVDREVGNRSKQRVGSWHRRGGHVEN